MAYACLIAYVAVLFIRPQDWVWWLAGVPILDFVVGVALITWLGSLARSRWRPHDAPQNWLMLGLLLAVLMSHVRHTYFGAFVTAFRQFGKVVLLYFLIASLVTSVRRARLLVLTMVVGCLFMALHGIMQAHTGAGFGGALPIYHQELVRVRGLGIFHDPNDLALILVAILPFLFSTTLNRESVMPARMLSALATLPVLYCIYLTNSRGGWLALGVMAAAYAYLCMPNKRLAAALAVVPLVAVCYFGPSRMGLLSVQEGAARGRVMAWGDGNRMLKRYPLFGVGKGRFTEFSYEGRVAHNAFVQCWADLGLFGYFFWLGLIIASLKDGRAMSKVTEEDPDAQETRRLSTAAMASLVGYLAASFFLSRTYTQPLYILFALFAALRTTYERDFGPLESPFVGRDLRYVLAAEVLSIPALYIVIRVLLL